MSLTRPRTLTIFTLLVLAVLPAAAWGAPAQGAATGCVPWIEPFDVFRPGHWSWTPEYSRSQAVLQFQKGYLAFVAPGSAPCQDALHSRFALEGDFEAEIEYEAEDTKTKRRCRFQGGMALTDAEGGVRYHADVAQLEPGRLVWAARWDRADGVDHEYVKGDRAPLRGRLRLVRTDGQIVFFARRHGEWVRVHEYKEPFEGPLYVTVHFASGRPGRNPGACPAFLRILEFAVVSCDGMLMPEDRIPPP